MGVDGRRYNDPSFANYSEEHLNISTKAQFNGKITVIRVAVRTRSHYTCEDWLQSHLAGRKRREIINPVLD